MVFNLQNPTASPGLLQALMQIQAAQQGQSARALQEGLLGLGGGIGRGIEQGARADLAVAQGQATRGFQAEQAGDARTFSAGQAKLDRESRENIAGARTKRANATILRKLQADLAKARGGKLDPVTGQPVVNQHLVQTLEGQIGRLMGAGQGGPGAPGASPAPAPPLPETGPAPTAGEERRAIAKVAKAEPLLRDDEILPEPEIKVALSHDRAVKMTDRARSNLARMLKSLREIETQEFNTTGAVTDTLKNKIADTERKLGLASTKSDATRTRARAKFLKGEQRLASDPVIQATLKDAPVLFSRQNVLPSTPIARFYRTIVQDILDGIGDEKRLVARAKDLLTSKEHTEDLKAIFRNTDTSGLPLSDAQLLAFARLAKRRLGVS